ncbi:zf-DHHC-domain-containing protein [Periconia macrospinosa]|uniref:Palmitoyltransferase PFA4 n=1 Tax=Periconia macrospinosa TaxID=97972 RepID=A0A2V1EDB2_9PLEO|nr:zf-DHHC-domain-containing protein [Periconia macrospinosa]
MEFSRLAVPAVYLLIAFLGYPSQILFLYLEPAPLTRNELILSNVLLVLIFITYTRSVYVDPGTIPRARGEETEALKEQGISSEDGKDGKDGKKGGAGQRTKWCRKCDAVKPPRAHHCKECKRCIPKMDHHCPWTANCVSHTTFPHFLRFLFYTTLGLSLLGYFLYIRLATLWSQRDLPSYLGPSMFHVGHLFLTTLVNSITLFALGILFVRNVWCLAVNTTTIEGWEIERHRTLVRRARHFGGWLDAPDGTRVRIKRQEFPYDVGIWRNVVQGMGSANPLTWLNPLAATPPLSTGLTFPTNDFEDASSSWPPPDPDRSFVRQPTSTDPETTGFIYDSTTLSPQETLAAFRARQHADVVRRRKPFVQRVSDASRAAGGGGGVGGSLYARGAVQSLSDDEEEEVGDGDESEDEEVKGRGKEEVDGEEAWRNSEGERLLDFGVDEEVEFYDEPDDDEDVPLSELLDRRRGERGY